MGECLVSLFCGIEETWWIHEREPITSVDTKANSKVINKTILFQVRVRAILDFFQ